MGGDILDIEIDEFAERGRLRPRAVDESAAIHLGLGLTRPGLRVLLRVEGCRLPGPALPADLHLPFLVSLLTNGRHRHAPLAECAKSVPCRGQSASACGPLLRRVLISKEKYGAPDRIRTCDLCLRRAALYPAELRVLKRGAETNRTAPINQ